MQEIEKLIEDFKAQLIEEMKDKMEDKLKKKGENITPISSDTLVQKIINIQQKKETDPLEELLKKTFISTNNHQHIQALL